jgi:hypothetical protein
MAVTLFRATTYSLPNLVEDVRRGGIALPDIQQPFVWKTTKFGTSSIRCLGPRFSHSLV